MAGMLASDLNNPEFLGATDPNAGMWVEFYWHSPIDKNESIRVGKRVVQKELELQKDGVTYKRTDRDLRIPYIRIMRPGDQTSILETAVREDHKAKWPARWMAWQIKEGLVDGTGKDIPGWNVDEWEEVNKDVSRVRELHYLHFHTVEQIAGASDAQVQRLGIGGLGLRERARVALRNKMGSETRVEIERRDKELAELKAQMAELMKKFGGPAEPSEKPQQPNQQGNRR